MDLTDLEKEVLSLVSLNKLQEISLGVPIRIPSGNVTAVLNNFPSVPLFSRKTTLPTSITLWFRLRINRRFKCRLKQIKLRRGCRAVLEGGGCKSFAPGQCFVLVNFRGQLQFHMVTLYTSHHHIYEGMKDEGRNAYFDYTRRDAKRLHCDGTTPKHGLDIICDGLNKYSEYYRFIV